jgi:hypothetical protein
MRPEIIIDGRIYKRNPGVDRYQIPIHELGDLKMKDIPISSHLEILDMEIPQETSDYELYGLNNGEFSVYGGISIEVKKENASKVIDRMRIAFPNEYNLGSMKNPHFQLIEKENGIVIAHTYLGIDFTHAPDTLVRDAISPYVSGFKRLKRPLVQAFICHASEDKPIARKIAYSLVSLGSEVWFDEWEIKVGESIVVKINEALDTMTHLVVLLSKNSVDKPWVKRELSSSLMRQLSAQAITLLPVVLDECKIPPLLSDIKHTNFNNGLEQVISELEAALFSNSATK